MGHNTVKIADALLQRTSVYLRYLLTFCPEFSRKVEVLLQRLSAKNQGASTVATFVAKFSHLFFLVVLLYLAFGATCKIATLSVLLLKFTRFFKNTLQLLAKFRAYRRRLLNQYLIYFYRLFSTSQQALSSSVNICFDTVCAHRPTSAHYGESTFSTIFAFGKKIYSAIST